VQFRIRGNYAQLLKTTSDSSGKTRSQPVGVVNLLTGKVSDRANAGLSGEETAEVERWLERRTALARRRQQLEVEELAGTLAGVVAWIDSAEKAAVEAVAEEIQFGLAEVRRALTAKLATRPGDADIAG